LVNRFAQILHQSFHSALIGSTDAIAQISKLFLGLIGGGVCQILGIDLFAALSVFGCMRLNISHHAFSVRERIVNLTNFH
jgi:hypothetical protein